MSYFNILKKVSLVSAGNIFNAGFGLIFLTASARGLSITDFGKYAFLTTLLVFMSKVIDFGSNSVFVAASLKCDNRSDLIKKFLGLKIVLFALAIFVSTIALFALGFGSVYFVGIFLLGLFFYSLNVTLFAVFQCTEKFTLAILLNTIPAFFKAIFGGLMLVGIINLSFENLYAIFCLSMGLCALLIFFLPYEFKKTFSLGRGIGKIVPILKTSAPAGVSQLISQGWPAISNTILKIARGFSDVGVFYLADKIANVFSLVSLSIFTVILPQNARRKRENLPHDLKETAFLALVVMVLAAGFVSVSGVFVSTIFGRKFSSSLLIIDILIVSSAVSAIHSFMENFFYVHDKTDKIMYISIIKLAIFLLLAFITIPMLSLKGLALSQLVSSIAGLLLVIIFTKRYN